MGAVLVGAFFLVSAAFLFASPCFFVVFFKGGFLSSEEVTTTSGAAVSRALSLVPGALIAFGFIPTIRLPLGLPGAFLLGVMSFIGREGPELPEPDLGALGLPTLVLGFGLAAAEGTLGLVPVFGAAGALGADRGAAGDVLARAAGG